MHAGYALVVGATLLRQGRHLLTRISGAAYPAFVVLVIVATGNHFFFDAFAGVLVDILAAAIAALLLRRAVAQPIVLPTRRPAAVPDRRVAIVRSDAPS